MNILTRHVSNRFHQELFGYDGFTSYESILEKIFAGKMDSKKNISSAYEVMDNYDFPDLTQCIEKILTKYAFGKVEIEDKWLHNLYFNNYKQEDAWKTWIYMMELSKRMPGFEFTHEVGKQEWNSALNITGKKPRVTLGTLDVYSYLLKNQLVDPINNLSHIVKIDEIIANKTGMKQLMTIFNHDPCEEVMAKIIEFYPLIKSQDPSMTGIAWNTFVPKVQAAPIGEQFKQCLHNLLHQEESFYSLEPQCFVIKLNLEAITAKRKSSFKGLREDGESFIVQVHELFSTAKDLGLPSFQCFQSKSQDIEKARHNSKKKNTSLVSLNEKSQAYLLQELVFSFDSEEDKIKKKDFFQGLLSQLISHPVQDKDQCMSIIKKAAQAYSLDISLEEKMTSAYRGMVKKI